MSRERAVEIVKSGSPEDWPKTRENVAKANEMGRVLQGLVGGNIECGYCSRVEVYKHLKKWVEGNGLL